MKSMMKFISKSLSGELSTMKKDGGVMLTFTAMKLCALNAGGRFHYYPLCLLPSVCKK